MPLKVRINPKVDLLFKKYPKEVYSKMHTLKDLIVETATEIEEILQLEITLKWGEPSFLTKNGSTIRIHWSPKSPNQYGMYFQCTSKLISTFKTVFKDTFIFEDNRAIIFDLDKEIPTDKLKYCIKTALVYHKVKHLPLLGI